MPLTSSRCGFSRTELLVVIAVIAMLGLLSALLYPAGRSIVVANRHVLQVRGKDIWMAIAAADAERAAVGLPSVWPSDVGEFNFTDSTAYFRYLFDEDYAGTTNGVPRLPGFDYSQLAGAGVPCCVDGKLAPSNNVWIIAKNVRDDMNGVLPVLVSCNVDAASLAAKVSASEHDRRVIFGESGCVPALGTRAFVMIRKNGATCAIGEKYRTYYVVYQGQELDTTTGPQGVPARLPLKYLTPTREVVPGEAAYADCLKRDADRKGVLNRMKRVFLPSAGDR
jgi:hypothetical protein